MLGPPPGHGELPTARYWVAFQECCKPPLGLQNEQGRQSFYAYSKDRPLSTGNGDLPAELMGPAHLHTRV